MAREPRELEDGPRRTLCMVTCKCAFKAASYALMSLIDEHDIFIDSFRNTSDALPYYDA